MPDIALPNGFTPRTIGQAQAMRYFDRGGHRGVYCWPRRFGKDLTFLHQTAKMAHERTGMYLHMLPNHKQARKVVWDAIDNDGRRIIDTVFPHALRESQNETEMKIKMKCGSLWQLVGSDYYDSIVGANPVGFVMSEAAISDPRAWDYFRPMLAANGGWAAFISTPRGRNWFHSLLKIAKDNPLWDWSHLTVEDTKHIAANVLAEERNEMADELYRQEYMCDFSAANVGAIFGRYIEAMERDGMIGVLPKREGEEQIIVSSDIGYADKSAFWWWRVMRGGCELFDFTEGSGLDAEEWCDRLREEHVRADIFVLPHDAKAKNFSATRTVVETFLKADIAERVIANSVRKKQDSINAGRLMMRNLRIDGERCEVGVEALRCYHFKYDDEQKCFSSEPEHDWSSHAADAFMEGAAYIRALREPEDKPRSNLREGFNKQFTLEELHDANSWRRHGRMA